MWVCQARVVGLWGGGRHGARKRGPDARRATTPGWRRRGCVRRGFRCGSGFLWGCLGSGCDCGYAGSRAFCVWVSVQGGGGLCTVPWAVLAPLDRRAGGWRATRRWPPAGGSLLCWMCGAGGVPDAGRSPAVPADSITSPPICCDGSSRIQHSAEGTGVCLDYARMALLPVSVGRVPAASVHLL